MFDPKLTLTNISQKNLIPLKDHNNNSFFIPEHFKNLNIPNSFLLLFGSVLYDDKSIVQLFEIDKVKKVVAGDTMCVVLMEDGKCFANVNDKFFELQLQNSDDLIVDVFAHTYLILVTDKGELHIYKKDNRYLTFYKKALKKEFNNEKITDIACGFNYFMILTENNNIYGYGDNSSGQLGRKGDFEIKRIKKIKTDYIPSKIAKIYCTYNNTLLLTKDGKCYACGDSCYSCDGQLNQQSAELACGGYNSIIVDKNRDIFMSGDSPQYSFYSKSKNYTNINLKSYFKNNDIFKANSNYKLNVRMGRYFTVIYSSKLNRKLNYKRSIKLTDIDIIVSDSDYTEDCCNFMKD
ncbi:hypothetical protein ABK040_012702 [Willaertia magna]